MKIKSYFLIISTLFIPLSFFAFGSDHKTDERTNPIKSATNKSFSSSLISVPDNSTVHKASSIVKATVVKSWYSFGGEMMWQHLNDYWWKYGNTEVIIDDTSLITAESFTFQDLTYSNADVVIISDPSGGLKQYTQTEKQALLDYCSLGHNLLGTFLVAQNGRIDNRLLAPLWGFKDTIQYNSSSVLAIYYYQDTTSYLFTNINEPYISNGYEFSQIPVGGNWITSGLNGAQVVGLTQDTIAIITKYNAGNYWSIYISNMPEYNGDSLDAQFLYNAITFNDQFTGIDDRGSNRPPILNDYLLAQNYPNPFNPITTIKYQIPEVVLVTLKVFDVLGNEIATLVNEEKPIGSYEVKFNATGLTSGVYFYQLKSEEYLQTKKMILLR
jgi:hypothetical protein